MRILFSTTAGAGHFGPLLPFARACVDAGHEVRVSAPSSFASAIARTGLAHAPFPDVPGDVMGAVFGRIPSLSMRAADALVIREVFGRLDAGAALPAVRAIVESWRPDVVVREPSELASYVAAEWSGVPQVQVNIGLDRFLDKLTILDEPLADLGSRRGVAGFLDLPRWTLVPASVDIAATGAETSPSRFRDGSAVARRGPDLPRWWPGREDPLVYVTFGSVAATIGLFPAFYARVVALLADAPVRVLLTLGEAGAADDLGTLPSNVHVEQWWPQSELMPHVAAVVGHGGFGTTLLALAAGVPQVVVPLFASDQFDNAERVAAVGAGVALQDPGVEHRLAGDMTPSGPAALESLPDAVLHAVSDASLRAGAHRVASEIAGLPDTSACVPELVRLVG